MTKRQPSGNPKGGQFAPDRKPDGGDLHPHITLDAGNMCLFCGRGSGFVNRVGADRTSDDGKINVSGYMCAECDGCEDDAVFRHCPECDEITAGDDEGICSSCGEKQIEDTSDVPLNIPRSLCTECTGETNFNFDAFAHELKGEVDITAPRSHYGEIEIVEWVNPNSYDNEVVMQVQTVESESPDDAEGWSARAFAQILHERRIGDAKMTDVLDVFDQGEVTAVAFDPKRGTHQVLMEINETLKEMS